MAGYAVKASRRLEVVRRAKEKEAGTLAGSRCRRAVTLSAALACTPSLFNGIKIAAVDKGIAEVDEIPEQLRSIQVMLHGS